MHGSAAEIPATRFRESDHPRRKSKRRSRSWNTSENRVPVVRPLRFDESMEVDPHVARALTFHHVLERAVEAHRISPDGNTHCRERSDRCLALRGRRPAATFEKSPPVLASSKS